MWIYGWNRPGFLPDSEPVECGTWDEAREALTWEVERWDEAPEAGQTSTILDSAAAMIAAAETGVGFSVPCGDYVLFVMEGA